MEASTASRTAMMTALMRAIHGRLDPLRLIDDPWGDTLVRDSAKQSVRTLTKNHTHGAQVVTDDAFDAALRGSLAFDNIILRARYTEDALLRALAAGVRQYVIIGAGFDSFALRQPGDVPGLQIYEIDHPATQNFKRARLESCGITPPANLHFLAADLSREGLAAVLGASGFDARKPAFFAWLGVTMYLTQEANQATLNALGQAAPAGSELVFNYMDSAIWGRPTDANYNAEFFEKFQQSVAAANEPLLSGFAPADIPPMLQTAGFALIEDATDGDLIARFDPAGKNGFRPNTLSRIVHARIG